MEPEDLLISTLEEFGFPVMLQGSLAPDAPYPDTFFTFWNNPGYKQSFYDNKARRIVYDYDVSIYSNDQELVYSKLREAAVKLEAAGFVAPDVDYSVPSGKTTHDGRRMGIFYVKQTGGNTHEN